MPHVVCVLRIAYSVFRIAYIAYCVLRIAAGVWSPVESRRFIPMRAHAPHAGPYAIRPHANPMPTPCGPMPMRPMRPCGPNEPPPFHLPVIRQLGQCFEQLLIAVPPELKSACTGITRTCASRAHSAKGDGRLRAPMG
jgi:hypothetical protein